MATRRRSGRNVIGGRSKAIQVSGIKELTAQIRDLGDAAAGKEAMAVIRAGAKVIADRTRQHARGQNWPQVAQDSIFSFGDDAGTGRRKKLSAIAGINKQRSKVEWTAGKNPKSPNAKVSHPGKVAMSIATMFEFGTSRMRARPAFRPAVNETKSEIIATVSAGLKDILERRSGGN